MSLVVKGEGLTFAYPSGGTLFAGVDLAVARGQVLCMTGRSGVGKSTLLFGLAGVLRLDGTVTLLGHELSASPAQRAALRLAHCGFVFQRGELLPELSILENVELPLRLAGRARRESRDAGLEALARLGIEHCAQRLPGEVSGGQGQRASVARALISRPAIVFADEPTAALDAASRESVISALLGAAEEGTSVICATHDPALLEICHDRIHLPDAARVSV